MCPPPAGVWGADDGTNRVDPRPDGDTLARPAFLNNKGGLETFDVVLANLDRFCSYADQRGTTVCLNACLLRDNVGGLVVEESDT